MSDDPTTVLPWWRAPYADASNPSYIHPSYVGGWSIGVFRDDRGNLTAKLWRLINTPAGMEKYIRIGFDSVSDAEAWCERAYAFATTGDGDGR